MRVFYSANGKSGTLDITSVYLLTARAEDLAELATGLYWKNRPTEIPAEVTLIHLQDVDGVDLGNFEVRRQPSYVFTATALPAA